MSPISAASLFRFSSSSASSSALKRTLASRLDSANGCTELRDANLTSSSNDDASQPAKETEIVSSGKYLPSSELRLNGSTTIHSTSSSSSSSLTTNSNTSSTPTNSVVGIAVGLTLGFIVFFAVCYVYLLHLRQARRKRRRKSRRRVKRGGSSGGGGGGGGRGGDPPPPPPVPQDAVAEAG